MREWIAFTIPGPPVTQGSMAVNRTTGQVFHSTHKRSARSTKPTLKQWRKMAGQAAMIAMRGRHVIDGPCELCAVAYLARPQRPRANRPDTKPDLDKIARAIGDALEGVVYVNDSRIVSLSIIKLWARDATDVRVDVQVREIREAA